MPYILQNRREVLDLQLDKLIDKLKFLEFKAGDMNYVISNIVGECFNNNPSYQTINDIVGALEGIKLEFYRRVVESYENSKVATNGDIKPYLDFSI